MVKVKPERTQGKQISIVIFLMRGQQTLAFDKKDMLWSKEVIEYEFIKQQCDNFLLNHGINYQTIIYTTDLVDLGKRIIVYPNFSVNVQQLILKMQGSLMIIIKGAIEQLKQEFLKEIGTLRVEITTLKQKIVQLQKSQRDYPELTRKNTHSPLPLMLHSHSQLERKSQNVELDIGILFAQPLYDEQKNRATLPAVDFRSQISRLNIALQSSYKPNIVMRSEIGTFQSLKSMIKLSKPKILHIVCHGSSDGFLQFEDDSRNVLGLLKYLKPQDLKNLLKNQLNNLPSLVFINSCYSEKIGQAFRELGVKHVICVNSTDPISDQAAMDFSQSFYRNIFKGQSVTQSFGQKQNIKQRGICCCTHNHKKNCKWMDLTKKYTIVQLHKGYHVPSPLCVCPDKNINIHKVGCQWARKVLFQINEDYRIKDQNTYRFPLFGQFPPYYDPVKKELIICCCIDKDKVPHSQSHKFKLFSQNENDVIFSIKEDKLNFDIDDLTQASLLQAHEKSKAISGRNKQLFQFLKLIKQVNIMAIYGKSGVGLTTFSLKSSTYMMERRIFFYFFFIDLYDIKDQIVFRYKFNQATNYQYTGEYINPACTKDKTLILFDNCDDFIKQRPQQFYRQITSLLKLIPKSKIIITFKQDTLNNFDEKKLTLCKKFQLPLIQIRFAVQFFNNKMKDKTDISVGFNQFNKLVRTYEVLRIPKVVLSISQSFSLSNRKITYSQIQKSVQGIKLSDTMKLTESVLNQLRQKSREAYEFLMFASQFTDGITFQDLNMFSNTHFRENTSIKLPVASNWQEHYLMLFQPTNVQNTKKNLDILMTEDQTQVQSRNKIQSPPPFATHHSQPQIGEAPIIRNTKALSILNNRKDSSLQGKSELDYLDNIDSQSYFVDKSGKGRFIVKRFIRDFVWKKHKNSVTNYMKFLYVAYFSVILQMLFQLLKQMNYLHEDLTTYSAISSSGLFSFNTSLSDNMQIQSVDLSQSQRFRNEFKKDLDTMFVVNQQLQFKMKKTDPSTFIMNHRHDFLKFYDNEWEEVYDYLKQEKNQVKQIFIIMFQNLMIYIPTAFKIANAEDQLIKYVIKGSEKQLKRVQKNSKPLRNLILQLKLSAIAIGVNLQNDIKLRGLIRQRKLILLDYQHQIKNKQIEINPKEFQEIQTMFMQQDFTLDLIIDLTSLRNQAPVDLIKHLNNKTNQFFKTIQNSGLDPLIKAKQGLLITLIFLNFLQKKTENVRLVKLSTQSMNLLEQVLKIIQACKKAFELQKCRKLELKIKLCEVQIKIHCNQLKSRYDQTILYQDILQCQNIYQNISFKLRVFTEFDNKIKYLKQQIKEKMWKSASKRIIFMKAFPIAFKDYPIIKNLIRRKNNFRQQIQKILTQSSKNNDQSSQRRVQKSPAPKSKDHKANEQKKVSLDISTKYQILTKAKIIEEAKANCSIMFITVDVRVLHNKLYLICENEFMEEELVEINKDLVKQLNIDNVLILVLSGVDTRKAMIKITQLCPSPPIIIALHSDPIQNYDEFDYTHELDPEWIMKIISRQNEIKHAQLLYTKYFIKRVTQSKIQSNEQVKKIHEQASIMMLKETRCEKVKGFISYQKCARDIRIKYKEGNCRDLSPGYQRNHNIDQKTGQNIILIRRWRKMLQFFKAINSIKQQPTQQIFKFNNFKMTNILSFGKKQTQVNDNDIAASYINIYGEIGCGKTYFIKEVAKILVERQFYDFGVYLFEGKKVEKNFGGDFQAYIKKQATSSRMPNLQNFKRILGHNTILIVDDFHLIKPRPNARMKMFMQQILQKKVNLILVSITELKQQFLPKMKKIKIQNLDRFETDVLAFNILNVKDLIEIRQYNALKQSLKQTRSPTFKQILDVKQRSKTIKRQNREQMGQQSDYIKMNKRNTSM